MKRKLLRLTLLSMVVGLMGAFTTTSAMPPAGDPVVIVVNKANATGDLSVDEVRKFFMGEKTKWGGGAKVNVAMLAAGSAERETALRVIFKMNEAEYNKYSMQAVFSGKMPSAPLDFPSPAMIKKFVASNPGAIAYIRKADVDDTVKVVCEIH